MTDNPTPQPAGEGEIAFRPLPEIQEELTASGDTFAPIAKETLERAVYSLTANRAEGDTLKPARNDRSVLTFDLHPLYAAILQDGATIRQGDVLGLDGDLRRVLVAPFDGTIRLLVTGTGAERRVRVFLSEQKERRELFAAGRR